LKKVKFVCVPSSIFLRQYINIDNSVAKFLGKKVKKKKKRRKNIENR